MLVDAKWVGIVVVAVPLVTLVWKLMGSPTPLSRQNLARPIRFAKRKYAACRNAATQRDAERAECAWRGEESAASDTLEASVDQLRAMQAEPANYHESEWNRRARACKEDALRYLRVMGVKVTTDKFPRWPLAVPGESGTIILDWGPSEQCPDKAHLWVHWRPGPPLTFGELIKCRKMNVTGQHEEVLSELLSDADMDTAS